MTITDASAEPASPRRTTTVEGDGPRAGGATERAPFDGDTVLSYLGSLPERGTGTTSSLLPGLAIFETGGPLSGTETAPRVRSAQAGDRVTDVPDVRDVPKPPSPLDDRFRGREPLPGQLVPFAAGDSLSEIAQRQLTSLLGTPGANSAEAEPVNDFETLFVRI